mgnify:CR=1 FL=1
MSSDSNSISAAIVAAQAESVNTTKSKKNNNSTSAADIADTISKEADTENLNRFNGIIDKLPIRTKLTISSLCLLDNISTQLLRFLIFNSNSPQVIALYVEHDTYLSSGETEIFQTLLQLFKQVRLIYNTRSPLLQVHDVAPGLWFPNTPAPAILMGHEAYIITAIRKANLLTFILTTLGCFNYGFELLQQSFMDIFCPNTIYTGNSNTEQIGKFLKSQAILYLDLKTQAYISGLRDIKGDSDELNDSEKMDLLKDIFPDDLADRLIQRRTGSSTANKDDNNMIPSEQDFIERCDRRKENLSNFTSYAELVESYDWNHFVKEILDYCNRNMGLIIWGRKGRGRSPLYAFDKEEFDNQVLYSSGAVAADAKNISGPFSNFGDLDSTGNFGDGMNLNAGLEDDDVGNHTNDYSQSMASFSGVGGPTMNQVGKDVTSSLVGAAIAASAKSGIKKLKPKRTWSAREDQALKKGLQEVGPSWSKILDLFGPGGKMSEDLKNRTQVQLKDKARNWKLHYLKNGEPLPDYLTKVTGTISKNTKPKKPKTLKGKAAKEAADAANAAAAAVAASGATTTNSIPDDSQQPSNDENQDTGKANNLFENTNDDNSSYDPNLESSV